MRNPKKNLSKESWERTSVTTKWDKLGQVGIRGTSGTRRRGSSDLSGSSVTRRRGSSNLRGTSGTSQVHLNHSTCSKWDYKAVEFSVKIHFEGTLKNTFHHFEGTLKNTFRSNAEYGPQLQRDFTDQLERWTKTLRGATALRCILRSTPITSLFFAWRRGSFMPSGAICELAVDLVVRRVQKNGAGPWSPCGWCFSSRGSSCFGHMKW